MCEITDEPGAGALETQQAAGTTTEAEALFLAPPRYTSGCSELDERVLGNRVTGGLAGGVVGVSSEGDIGISVALQVAVHHLRRDATATARLVTTLPMEHAVRLLKGVLKGVLKTTTEKGSKELRASILGRVLISRIYAQDDLEAVLAELEAGVPFERLWSAAANGQQNGASAGHASHGTESSPSILILTEVDHHFKWMRLQGQAGRVHELYGQLMRRLRCLAAGNLSSGIARNGCQRLIFLLNNTLTRVPGQKPDGGLGVYDYETRETVPHAQPGSHDATYHLALNCLQQRRHAGRPDAFRLCCDELAKAQCIEPRYRYLMNYYCSLHVCLTRLPADLVDLWGGSEGGSAQNIGAESSLWVGNIETDENELGCPMADRFGVVHYHRGFVQDASLT